jgi:hypothetical protein
MNAFEQIAVDRQNERKIKLVDWYRLLGRIDLAALSEKDRKTLAKLMEELNRTPAQATADHAAVASVRQRIEWAGTKSAAESELERANEAHSKGCAERQQLWAAMNAKVAALTGNLDSAQSKLQQANQSRGELDRLKQENPELHAAIVG